MLGILVNLLLATAWVFMTGSFDLLNYAFGFALGFLVIALVHRVTPPLYRYPRRIYRGLVFAFYFAGELLVANWRVAMDIITPPWHMQPGVVAIPLKSKGDLEITLFANLVSLTPGTLSLEVSEDQKQLFVHAMFLDDEHKLRAELSELEQRLLDVLR